MREQIIVVLVGEAKEMEVVRMKLTKYLEWKDVSVSGRAGAVVVVEQSGSAK